MARPERVAIVKATPTLDTSIYASGDSLHTADLTFDNCVMFPSNSGLIKKVAVWDKSTQGVNLELWLFSRALSNTTHTANGAWNLADADLPYLISVVPVSTWYAGSDNKWGTSAENLDIPFRCEADTTKLYGVLVTRGTPTYAASDLTVGVVIDRLD